MKAADPGLRAVTESWMGSTQVLESQPVPPEFLPRLDPTLGSRCWSMPGSCPGIMQEPNAFVTWQRLSAPVG